MSNIVFDSSVVLALLKGEEITLNLPDLRWATMSTVNVAEVWTKLSQGNETARSSGIYLIDSLRDVVPFTREQAQLAGELQMLPGVKGISLGDRACLSLAIATDAEVYTADRTWSRLNLPCVLHLIR